MLKIRANSLKQARLANKALAAVMTLPVGDAYKITEAQRGVAVYIAILIKKHGLGKYLTVTERRGVQYLFKTNPRWWKQRGKITLLTHKKWGITETFATKTRRCRVCLRIV